LGQLPFLWSAGLLFIAVGLWRRRHPNWAVLLAGLAQATHPPVMMPLVLLIAAVALARDAEGRGRTIIAYVSTVAIALPAVYMVFASPVVEDTRLVTQVANLGGTVGWRLVVVAAPFLLTWQLPHLRGALPPALAGACVAATLALIPLRHDDYGWGALTRRPDESLQAFIRSPDFHAGATYRILRAGDGKVGMYDLIRGGARIDSEFFPESIDRRSWTSTDNYAAFLAARGVEYVIVYGNYDSTWHTNEHDLLRQLSQADCVRFCASFAAGTQDYEVYAINGP
jgi:hypothetical protein